jgi:hypothetical protein
MFEAGLLLFRLAALHGPQRILHAGAAYLGGPQQ